MDFDEASGILWIVIDKTAGMDIISLLRCDL